MRWCQLHDTSDCREPATTAARLRPTSEVRRDIRADLKQLPADRIRARVVQRRLRRYRQSAGCAPDASRHDPEFRLHPTRAILPDAPDAIARRGVYRCQPRLSAVHADCRRSRRPRPRNRSATASDPQRRCVGRCGYRHHRPAALRGNKSPETLPPDLTKCGSL